MKSAAEKVGKNTITSGEKNKSARKAIAFRAEKYFAAADYGFAGSEASGLLAPGGCVTLAAMGFAVSVP